MDEDDHDSHNAGSRCGCIIDPSLGVSESILNLRMHTLDVAMRLNSNAKSVSSSQIVSDASQIEEYLLSADRSPRVFHG